MSIKKSGLSPNTQPYFPLFVSLDQKKVLVFGGGTVATRRIFTLLEFGADIRVIAPEYTDEIRELAAENKIMLERRLYSCGEIAAPDMVLAATDDSVVNEKIYDECRKKGILINTASEQEKSDFFFPGIIREDSLVIGVTASGSDHKKVKRIAERIRSIIKEETK